MYVYQNRNERWGFFLGRYNKKSDDFHTKFTTIIRRGVYGRNNGTRFAGCALYVCTAVFSPAREDPTAFPPHGIAVADPYLFGIILWNISSSINL